MKYLIISKKTFIAICIGVCAVVAACFSPLGSSVMTAAAKRELPIYNVQKSDKVVSFSFDAAWGNEDTATLIDILGKYNIKATFFVVGDWVDKYPESVKQLADAGHEIMNHSNTHPHMTQLSADKMLSEVNSCSDKIEKITGVRPTLFRAPYGDYDDKVITTLRDGGYYTIQWDVDSPATVGNA